MPAALVTNKNSSDSTITENNQRFRVRGISLPLIPLLHHPRK
jgi:hypothetical protein